MISIREQRFDRAGDLRLIRLIEERPGNVTGAIAEEEDGVGDDFFGVSYETVSF